MLGGAQELEIKSRPPPDTAYTPELCVLSQISHFSLVLGIRPSISHMQDKCSSAEHIPARLSSSDSNEFLVATSVRTGGQCEYSEEGVDRPESLEAEETGAKEWMRGSHWQAEGMDEQSSEDKGIATGQDRTDMSVDSRKSDTYPWLLRFTGQWQNLRIE